MYQNDHQSTRFGLIRHMETVWNRAKRIQGQKDSPLTKNGAATARRLGIRLRAYGWDRIISSDLGRAVQTGQLINEALDVPLETMPAIQEMDWGTWTGLTMAQVRERDPDRLARLETDFWDHRPPQGETRKQLFARSSKALIWAARRYKHETILVVLHGGVLKALFQGLPAPSVTSGENPRATGYLHFFTSDGQTLQMERAASVRILP